MESAQEALPTPTPCRRAQVSILVVMESAQEVYRIFTYLEVRPLFQSLL